MIFGTWRLTPLVGQGSLQYVKKNQKLLQKSSEYSSRQNGKSLVIL